MKIKSVFVLLMCVACMIANAQKGNVPAPETLSEIRYYDKAANTNQALEKNKAKMVTKAKAMGLGGASTNYVIDGEKSPVRLQKKDSTSFIVTLAEGMGEPSVWFGLFKVDVKKGKRSGNFINSKVLVVKSKEGDGIIPFTVKSLGNHVFEIIPSEKLEAGEYFFVNKGSSATYGGQAVDAFAFGID